jgi:predicted DNA repair protein MutK
VITLGTVAGQPFGKRFAVLTAIALLMTVGVYGLVAGIVKLDDLGLRMTRMSGATLMATGRGILRAAPWLMKALAVAGTAAMFLVGGGILTHGLPWLHHHIEALARRAGDLPTLGGVLQALAPSLLDALVGVIAGALVLLAVSGVSRLRARA